MLVIPNEVRNLISNNLQVLILPDTTDKKSKSDFGSQLFTNPAFAELLP
jgi:hypothetical protein